MTLMVNGHDSIAVLHFESWDFTARGDADAQPVSNVMSVGKCLGGVLPSPTVEILQPADILHYSIPKLNILQYYIENAIPTQ